MDILKLYKIGLTSELPKCKVIPVGIKMSLGHLAQRVMMVYIAIAGSQNPNDSPITRNNVLDNLTFCSIIFRLCPSTAVFVVLRRLLIVKYVTEVMQREMKNVQLRSKDEVIGLTLSVYIDNKFTVTMQKANTQTIIMLVM